MSVVVADACKDGSQRAPFLSVDSEPRELDAYIRLWLAAIGVSGGTFPTSPKTDVWVGPQTNEDGERFTLLDFRDGGVSVRTYHDYPDRVAMIYDRIRSGADTPGHHAWFISAHLRSAWIIRRKEQQVAVVDSSN